MSQPGSVSPLDTGLNVTDFSIALRSGIHRVINDQDTLNRINVFPVADGDTGTNLGLTLGAALAVLGDNVARPIGQVLASVADAMLDGARGNSGAIVAQFFQGMSDAAVGLENFTPATFSRAVALGDEYAHDALSQPREGTILSAIRAFSASLEEQTRETSMARLLREAVAKTRSAMDRTQSQLEVLRKAGVVDAGARGFYVLVSGIADFLADGTIAEAPAATQPLIAAPSTRMAGSEDPLRFRYCTECIVTGENIDRRKLREALADAGDSLVLAGTKRKARIHIHVNRPEAVFAIARQYGTLALEKADDMQRQQHSSHNDRASFAVITDSAADIFDEAMERLDIHMVPARIQFGDRGYLDKVSISSEEFFRELASNPAHPTTSQPAPGDFRRQFQFLASHFSDVLYVSLTPKVSGTFQAAQSAAARISAPGRIHVVDSRNASLGQGLLAVFAAECAEAGLDIDSALDALDAAVRATWTFALVNDLRFAVRGGRVPPVVKSLSDWLGITPVLQTTKRGEVTVRGALAGRKRRLHSFARYISRRVPKSRRLRVSIGHALALEEARELATLLQERLPMTESCELTQLGSAVGVHGGPGTLVVGVQEVLDPASFRRR